jgi:tRNA threonylcarbamoyladenosine biosynthesis protein TsaE
VSAARSLALPDEAATRALGERLAWAIVPPFVLHLRGELGAGKTTLARALVQARAPGTRVKSPTYTLVERYDWPDANVAHLDLYRIADPHELEYLGLRELSAQGVLLIEWPERGGAATPTADLVVTLSHHEAARAALIEACTPAGESALARV